MKGKNNKKHSPEEEPLAREENKTGKKKKNGGKGRAVARWLIMFFTIFTAVVALSVRWMLANWADMEMNELLFQLTSPLEGTGNGMVGKYILNCIVPAAILWAVLHFISVTLQKKGKSTKLLSALMLFGSIAVFAGSFYTFDSKVHLISYIRGKGTSSTFIEDNYVNPEDVEIDFPEKKRNLIYIFMESTEVTFTDKAHGGAFDEDVIPELTSLAEENEDFSGTSGSLDGGISLYGTTWTMGAMFGQTSGLPLETSVGANNMDTMSSFFPGLTTLGDILEDEGYDQTLMLGSKASFGGRKLYFTEHGNYAMQDYNYALDNGLIPEGYNVWWGFEDEKLFSFAKDTITEKAAGDSPFNVTLLTVDTHFPDGYVCELCPDTYDDQYSNVFACASRQVSDFVAWCQQQDWYDNTTIIISGDHPTMDVDYCEDVPADYQRKVYTCYINSATETDPSEGERTYSTFDDFPTTLAALGVEIEGNRLGLGTNLFSTEQTLTEQYGVDYVNAELQKKSDFLDTLEAVDMNSPEYRARTGLIPDAQVYLTKKEDGQYQFRVTNFRYIDEAIQSVSVDLSLSDGTGSETESTHLDLMIHGDGDYYGETNLSEEMLSDGSMTVSCTTSSGSTYTLYSREGELLLANRATFITYISNLIGHDDYTVFVAARDDAATNLSLADHQALEQLGLVKLPAYRQSYIGIVESGNVLADENSDDELIEEGSLSDGTTYQVISDGYMAGRQTSFMINGEYVGSAPVRGKSGSRGLNFVVYSTAKHAVVDTYRYDSWVGTPGAVMTIGSRRPLTSRYVVTVADITGCLSTDRGGRREVTDVTLYVWSEDDPGTIETFSLDDVSDKVGGDLKSFSNRINLKDFKGKTVYIDAVATNERGVQNHVGKITAEIS